MDFGKMIKEYRKEHKMTQREMAEAVGISRYYLLQIEHGRQPAIRAEKKLLDFFKKIIKKA